MSGNMSDALTDDFSAETVYLDYAASTPLAPEVRDAMLPYLDGVYANPSAQHIAGRAAKAAIEQARQQLADLLGAESSEVLFTSGATEANNLAIRGAVAAYGRKLENPHIITTAIEHKSVLAVCAELEKPSLDGRTCDVSYIKPDSKGLIDPAEVAAAINDRTVLCSIHLVNNELGVLQNILAIAQAIAQTLEERPAGAPPIKLHVDASQAVGKLPLQWASLPADYLSLSAHKFYGPKGVGALLLRAESKTRVVAQQLGGSQEKGLRAGTLATHQIVGLGAAAHMAERQMAEDTQQLLQLRQQLMAGVAQIPKARLNCADVPFMPTIFSLTLPGMHGEALWLACDRLMVSAGSACNSDADEPSYVLKALGMTDRDAEATLRLSIGRYTTEDDIDVTVETLSAAVDYLELIATGKQPSFTLQLLSDDKVAQYFSAVKNVGVLDDGRVAREQSAAYGDAFTLYRQSSAETDQYRWKAWGCPELLAALSWSSEWALKKADFAPNVNDFVDEFKLPAEKRYIATMLASAWRAIKS